MRKLIINADDFGMSREVNEGTKKGIHQGIITSVSIMVNMPYFEDAITFLKKYPQVSVGLHFNITEGKPILIPNYVGTLLREDDSFYFWTALAWHMFINRVSLKEIDEELKAQYAKLKQTKVKITHIDSHHHIHLFPSVFKIVNAFADKQGVGGLRGNRFNVWNLTVGTFRKPITTQLIVNTLLLMNTLRMKNYEDTRKISRFYDINWSNNMPPSEFAKILKNLPEGTTEFICHLAVLSDTGNRTFLQPRYKALKLLTNPQIKKHLKKNGITLSSRKHI